MNQTATKPAPITIDLEPSSENLPAKSQVGNFLDVLAQAVADPRCDVDKMERLLAMQERVVAKRAEMEYNEAMRLVQAEMPRIEMDRKNEHTRSRYATLTKLNQVIIPIYTKHGFSLSFSTVDSPKPDHIRVICIVAHIGGFSRTHQHDVAVDTVGTKGTSNKTETQGEGSSLSYARRYITLMIFNATMRGEDDDGNQGAEGNIEYITASQVADLEALLGELGADDKERAQWKTRFLKFIKCDSLEDIRASSYDAAVREVKARIAQNTK